MKAGLFDGKGRMQVVDLPRPTAGPGEVIVDVVARGICGSDLQINARKTVAETQPGGHEAAGAIVEVGDGVDRSVLGRRVAMEIVGQARACGECWYCRSGLYPSCMNARPAVGAFAEFIKMPLPACYSLPDSLTWEEGAMVEPLAVAVHGVRRGQLLPNETVVVLGSGTMGLTAVAASRASGAGQIFATARYNHQAELALRLGATKVFRPDDPAIEHELLDATHGRGADVTFETIGGTDSGPITQAINLTRRQGRIVGVGSYREPVTFDIFRSRLKEHSIIFANCYSVLDGYHDFEIAIDLMASGRINLKPIVTHRFPLDDIQKAFEAGYDRKSGAAKVMLTEGTG